MRVHFIAIGGAVMHNLAMALHNKGYKVTGSDDEILEPSKSRLEKYGLLPENKGWDANKITKDIDAVILGMHALEENPELKRAQELGIKIYSFPAYMYEQTKDKKRIVIAGSHGKTTITSMILHVLKVSGRKFDYLVGSQIEGFETMADVIEDSDIAVFEGDEYLTSPIDRVPKFYHYRPHITVLSGIAWDHFNVFPTFDEYLYQFKMLLNRIEADGRLFYDAEDKNIPLLKPEENNKIHCEAYKALKYENSPEGTKIITEKRTYFLKIFGNHNMKNLNAARLVCKELGIADGTFYSAMENFKGAKRRLEVIEENDSFTVYTDFAHAPSKVKATLAALKEKYPSRKLVAFFELHTFSSLNKDFLPQYAHSMDHADQAFVYFNEEVILHKKLENLSSDFVRDSFLRDDLIVICSVDELIERIQKVDRNNTVVVFMSSGNFSGINFKTLVNNI